MNRYAANKILMAPILVFVLFISGCLFPQDRAVPVEIRGEPTGHTAPGEGFSFRLGIAAVLSPGQLHKAYAPLADLLAEELGQPVDLVQRTTYNEMNLMVQRREVDMAFVCSLAYVLGRQGGFMEPLAIPVVDGQRHYRSCLVVRRDDPAEELSDLEGRDFAFTDALSFSGRLTAVYWLMEKGHSPWEFFSSVTYTYSHDNSLRAVARGVVDGAVVDSLVLERMLEWEPEIDQRLKVLSCSEEVGTPPFVVHPQTDAGLKKALTAFLTGLHDTPEGQQVLEQMGVDRFDAPDDDAYDLVARMWDHVQTYDSDH